MLRLKLDDFARDGSWQGALVWGEAEPDPAAVRLAVASTRFVHRPLPPGPAARTMLDAFEGVFGSAPLLAHFDVLADPEIAWHARRRDLEAIGFVDAFLFSYELDAVAPEFEAWAARGRQPRVTRERAGAFVGELMQGRHEDCELFSAYVHWARRWDGATWILVDRARPQVTLLALSDPHS